MKTTDPYRLNRVYRLRELPAFVGLPRTVIAGMIKAGDFPQPIKLNESGRAVGWLEQDLVDWQHARIKARKSGGLAAAKHQPAVA
jgi:predicted DNA-binding transcriptional regulator AlpA